MALSIIYFSIILDLPHIGLDSDFSTTVFLMYKVLNYLSFTLDQIEGRQFDGEQIATLLFRMFHYAFYLPYLAITITLYNDFESQLAQRRIDSEIDWRNGLVFGLRILFWYSVAEIGLNFFYFEAILKDNDALNELPLDTLTALGYAAGR